jgi:methylenetetrahydrofolate--tRNA-(uracil-5-)-methyltransferase
MAEEERKKIRDKKERHRIQCERALAAFDGWLAERQVGVSGG